MTEPMRPLSHSAARPARILVVDDEAHLADGIRENLEAEGYETDVAHDGAEGLEKIRRGRFDLILLDVMMPKMNGLEVCEAIRAEGIQTPVMFLTVKGDPEDRIAGLAAGGDDYLAKPFHPRALPLRAAAIPRRSRWDAETASTLGFRGDRIHIWTYHARSWGGREHALQRKETMVPK
nr:DNA-binding response regulator [Gammaproteobacteria bacterium]